MNEIDDSVLICILQHLPCVILDGCASLVCRRWRAIICGVPRRVRPLSCTLGLERLPRPHAWVSLGAQQAQPDTQEVKREKPQVERTRPQRKCAQRSTAAAATASAKPRRTAKRTTGKKTPSSKASGDSDSTQGTFAVCDGIKKNSRAAWCKAAAQFGHLACLRYAHESRGKPLSALAARWAAAGNHVDCLRYMCERGVHCDRWTTAVATRTGSLQALVYLHETQGCPWDQRTTINAASGGHLECLRYAHANGCPWTADVCKWASCGGHLACLEYAHDNGCEWDAETYTWAFGGGHMECVRYAHSRGCPWNQSVCAAAALSPYITVSLFALAHGCKCDQSDYLDTLSGMHSLHMRDDVERF